MLTVPVLQVSTPLGGLLVAACDSGLVAAAFAERAGRLHAALHRRGLVGVEGTHPQLVAAAAWLDGYFGGDFSLAAPACDGAGTAFERAVWRRLGALPAGGTTSYGELARHLGRPLAARAVGAANARNPLPLFVPCHRVVGSGGALTGYAFGVDRKRWLLRHEAAVAQPQLRLGDGATG